VLRRHKIKLLFAEPANLIAKMALCTACQNITLEKLTTPLKHPPSWMEERYQYERIYSSHEGMEHFQDVQDLAKSAKECALCALINQEAPARLGSGPILLCPLRHSSGFPEKKSRLRLSGFAACLPNHDSKLHHTIELSLFADEGISSRLQGNRL
jgi:hypothetical protein